MEKVTFGGGFVTGVAAPRGDPGLWRDRCWPSTDAPLYGKTLHSLHEKTQDKPKVEKGYIKNQVTYQKKRAALSGKQDMRSDTRQGLPRQRATEWFPLKSQALCFTGDVDNAQMITVPSVPYVLALAQALWHRGRKPFSSQRTRGMKESGRALGRALWTPMLSISAGALFAKKTHLNHSTFQKQAFLNGIRLGLNSDGVYTFRLI